MRTTYQNNTLLNNNFFIKVDFFSIVLVILVVLFLQTGCSSSGITKQGVAELNGKTRIYYIAAEDVLWDYAPSYPINSMSGKPFSEDAKVFVEGNQDNRIGRQYWKALYREYTDETFTRQKSKKQQWQHTGTLGPVIRAVVGDTIKIVFKNMTTDKTLSMHPHGVFYDKASEGSTYKDGSNSLEKLDNVVTPGNKYTYVWKVPDRAGPAQNDPSSIVWLYHSHVDEAMDTNSGLIGAIIVTRREMALEDGTPKDVDREFINLFTVFDENSSLYLQQNIKEFAPNADNEDQDFQESNLMHATNGYLYGNLQMTMNAGEKIRWYLLAMGTEVDLHTPHWHGNTVTWNGQRTDVVELLPASMKTVDMLVDNPGVWMYHCHVNDHIDAGMMTTYEVVE